MLSSAILRSGGLPPSGSGSGGFNIASLGVTAIADWWADDHGGANMTDDGAGLISAWADRIGGISVTAATTARPTYGATSFNGLAGLTFDGSANAMTTTSLGSIPVSSNPSAIFVLLSTSVGGRVFTVGNNTAGQDRRITSSSSAASQSIGDGTTNISDAFSTGSGTCVISAIFDGAKLLGFSNGKAFGSVALVPATGSTRLRIGASAAVSAGVLFTGIIRRVVVCTTLTTARRQQVEGYLAWDGGIQSSLDFNHPYRSVRP